MWNKNFSPASAPQLRSENLSPAFALQVRRLIWKIKVYRSASLTCAQGPAPAPAGGETQPGFRARLTQAGTKPGCVLFPAPKHRFWPYMDPFRRHALAPKRFLLFPSGHISRPSGLETSPGSKDNPWFGWNLPTCSSDSSQVAAAKRASSVP